MHSALTRSERRYPKRGSSLRPILAIAWMVQIRPLAVVDGQVSGIGGVSVEGNESVHRASNAWIKRDANTPICDPSLRGS